MSASLNCEGGRRIRDWRWGKRALLQSDMVGDFGQGAFALLLKPGVRHCGFLCRGSEATMMRGVEVLDA